MMMMMMACELLPMARVVVRVGLLPERQKEYKVVGVCWLSITNHLL
jgi:hypothetical protein